jgi:hypothetical protein
VNGLLHKVLTDVPLLAHIGGHDNRAMMEFRNTDGEPCVDVGRGYYLYLGQTLQAKRESKKEYSLRTMGYAYRIATGPKRNDPYVVRWEYNSRELLDALHPRHHCHLPVQLECAPNRRFNLDKMHIASGWVTIEEVLRYLFHELKVPPRAANWDKLLRDSEQTFRQRTSRSI